MCHPQLITKTRGYTDIDMAVTYCQDLAQAMWLVLNVAKSASCANMYNWICEPARAIDLIFLKAQNVNNIQLCLDDSEAFLSAHGINSIQLYLVDSEILLVTFRSIAFRITSNFSLSQLRYKLPNFQQFFHFNITCFHTLRQLNFKQPHTTTAKDAAWKDSSSENVS
jgi:hypothetical protein